MNNKHVGLVGSEPLVGRDTELHQEILFFCVSDDFSELRLVHLMFYENRIRFH